MGVGVGVEVEEQAMDEIAEQRCQVPCNFESSDLAIRINRMNGMNDSIRNYISSMIGEGRKP